MEVYSNSRHNNFIVSHIEVKVNFSIGLESERTLWLMNKLELSLDLMEEYSVSTKVVKCIAANRPLSKNIWRKAPEYLYHLQTYSFLAESKANVPGTAHPAPEVTL